MFDKNGNWKYAFNIHPKPAEKDKVEELQNEINLLKKEL